MANNPLDQFVSKGRAKFVVKVPQVPKMSESVRKAGLTKGAETHDERLELWRRDLEKSLERLTSNLEHSISEAVKGIPPATTIIDRDNGTVTPPPVEIPDDICDSTKEELLAAIEVLQQAIDALQVKVDALEEPKYSKKLLLGGM